MLRLAAAILLVQAGFHMYTASLPLALSEGGMPDPTIGLLVGVSALVQIPAAFAGGSLLDRFGGIRLFRVGGVMYLLASAIVLIPLVAAGGSVPAIVAVRFLQGVGLALCLPAALSLVPRLVILARRGIGLSIIGGAQNLALLVFPPLSLVILRASTLSGVAAVTIVLVGAAILLVTRLPFRPTAHLAAEAEREAATALPPAGRRFGFAYRPSWGRLLLITLLYVAHWGVVTAYLPQRAAASGADVGLFFVADGLGIVLIRVPSGWLSDRVTGRWLVSAGLLMTAFALILLLPMPTTALLVVAGLAGGFGGGLVLTPILLELSRRSADADRGSAFSLFSGALAGAVSLGSIGGAPIMAAAGFDTALAIGIGAILAAVVITMTDAGLAVRPMTRLRMPRRPIIRA